MCAEILIERVSFPMRGIIGGIWRNSMLQEESTRTS